MPCNLICFHAKCTAGRLTPDSQVQLPTVQDVTHSQPGELVVNPRKNSGASVSATQDPPRPSTKGVCQFTWILQCVHSAFRMANTYFRICRLLSNDYNYACMLPRVY